MPSVFISYSSKDRELADHIASEMKSNDIDVFIDHQRLNPGHPFSDQLYDQIKARDCVIFIVSSNSVDSKWVEAEIKLAHDEDKRIIPVILEQTDKFKEKFWFIRYIHQIDFTAWKTNKNVATSIQKLLSAIRYNQTTIQLPLVSLNRKQTRKRLWLLIPLLILIFIAVSLLVSRFSKPPKVSLAYSFLLDTSEAMKEQLNGASRYEIAKHAIDKIVNFTGFDVKDTWRVLRKAGGDNCDDTKKLAEGSSASIPPEAFMNRLNGINPQGSNAYEKGINEALNDLVDPDSPAISSDVKVAFIFFASLNPNPCSPYPEDLIAALRIYKIKGIKTGLCFFGLGVDLPGFQRVRDAAAAQGVDTKCFYNFDDDNAEDIAKIAIGVIQRQIGLATNEQEITPFIPRATIPNISTPAIAPATATLVTHLPPTWTPTPTIAPNQPVEARGGPGLFYPIVATIPAGQQLNFIGISEDKSWAQVTLPNSTSVWVSVAGYGDNILNVLNNLPIVPGPTNTPTPTSTSTPSSTPTITPTYIPTCPGARQSYLYPGVVGYVLGGDPLPVNVRSGPSKSGQKLAQIPVGGRFTVLDGPNCNEDKAWFRVRLENGVQEGWIAEGDQTGYFVSPVDTTTQQTTDITRISITPEVFSSRILSICTPALEDEFTNGQTSNDWFQDKTTNAISNEEIINGFYQIRINQIPASTDEMSSWGSLRGFTFRDGRVEVVVSAANFSNITSRVGIWLRYQDEKNFIAFMIRNNGSYYVGRWQDNSYQDIVNWTQVRAIHTGDNSVNTLRVDIVGDNFTIFINGVELTKFTDNTWPEGRIAFFGASKIVPNSMSLDYLRVCNSSNVITSARTTLPNLTLTPTVTTAPNLTLTP